MLHEAQRGIGLVVAGDARESFAGRGAGGCAAAADEVHAEDSHVVGIERAPRPHDLAPPAFRRIPRIEHLAGRGNAAQGQHNGSVGASREAPADGEVAKRAAMMQDGRTVQLKHSLLHLRHDS